jgi:hypothetical protein
VKTGEAVVYAIEIFRHSLPAFARYNHLRSFNISAAWVPLTSDAIDIVDVKTKASKNLEVRRVNSYTLSWEWRIIAFFLWSGAVPSVAHNIVSLMILH